MTLKELHADVAAWTESPRGLRVCQRVSRGLLLATLAFLAYKLSQLGWGQVWRCVPTQPAFYLLFVVNYLLLPMAGALTFRLVWKFDFWRSLPIFFRRQVYNQDVVDYSGEVYLYVWATKRLGQPEMGVLRAIKDNAILSSLAAFLVTLVMPAACFACGLLAPNRDFASHEITALVAGPLLILGALGLLLAFRGVVFSLPIGALAAIGAIHLGRFLLINVLTVVQWWVVMPEQPLYVWCTLITAQNLIGRLPSLTQKDLIFVAAGVELSQGLSAPAAAVAGMLLVNSVLEKLANALAFSSATLLTRAQNPKTEPAATEPLLAGDNRRREACYEGAH